MVSRYTPWLIRFSSRLHQISRHHWGLWVTTMEESVDRTTNYAICMPANYSCTTVLFQDLWWRDV